GVCVKRGSASFNFSMAVRSSRAILGRLSQFCWLAANVSNNVNGTIHRPKMDTGQVFAYYAKSEKLCAGKDRNYGSQKWNSRHGGFHEIAGEDVKEDRESE